MVGKLLMHGMVAGIVAGLLTFAFARVAGEPLVDTPISFEETMHAMHGDGGHRHEELVSRSTQAGIGLLTGVVAYGAAFGGLFSLTFAWLNRRMRGLSARALSVWLAIAAFTVLILVPAIKYPANPPAVGNPDTIGSRTGLYFLLIATSIFAAVFSTKTRTRLLMSLGPWNASLVAGLTYIVIMCVIHGHRFN